MAVSIRAILLSGTGVLIAAGVADGLGEGVAAGLGAGVGVGLGTLVCGRVCALTTKAVVASNINAAKITLFITSPG
jgi:uncharacterized protein YqfA (UPF0365 family)